MRKPKRSNRIKKVARVTEPPLTRLVRTGSLNVYEHTAADELHTAYSMAAGLPVTRDPSLGIPAGMIRADAADDSAARQSDILRAYQAWLHDVQASPAQIAVQAIVVEDVSMRSLERQMRWRNGTAKKHLFTGLRHFAALRGNVPRGARDWKLTSTPPQKKETTK